MNPALKIIPIILYSIVGLISMLMAVKSIFADRYLPFHEKAADRQWDEIERPLKIVILSLLRLGGLGFLVISILLIAGSIINFYIQNDIYKYVIPVIALIYCTGLFINNYLLFKETNTRTPWKGSLYAVFIIITGIIISIFC
jgi:hypothetical protein